MLGFCVDDRGMIKVVFELKNQLRNPRIVLEGIFTVGISRVPKTRRFHGFCLSFMPFVVPHGRSGNPVLDEQSTFLWRGDRSSLHRSTMD